MKQYQFILVYNNIPTELSINPAGWDNLGVSFIRNITYHSVLRSLTLPLRFAKKTGGGTDVILNAYNTDGISAVVNIIINRRDPKVNDYAPFYKGDLDFKPGKLIIERDFIEVGTLDTIKLQRFISRDNINYNVFSTLSADNVNVTPFVTPKKTITLTPIDIILRTTGEAAYNDTANNKTYADGLRNEYLANPAYVVNEIGDRVSIDGITQTLYTNSTSFAIDLRIKLEGIINRYGIIHTLSGSSSPWPTYHTAFSIEVYDSSSTQLHSDVLIFDDIIGEPGDDVSYNVFNTINYNKTYTVPKDGYVIINYYFQFFAVSDGETSVAANTTGTLSFDLLEYSAGATETTAPCLFPFEAFTRLLQLTTSEVDETKIFDSTFFGRVDSEFKTYSSNGEGSLDAIMGARMIRNYPNEPLTINLRDLFKSFDSIYNLGLGYDRINDRFYIEKKEKFYDSSYFMFSLGEVKELKITPMTEGYFNQILGGTAFDGNYEEIQGAYEFNLQREYATSAPVKEDCDIRSTYNTDSVGIEVLRRKQYTSNASEDSRLDKYVYIARTDGKKPILNSAITGFQGIEKYYNTMLTPRQNAVRWGNILKACLYKSSNPISFQKAIKTVQMLYDGKDELSSIDQSEMTDSTLFIPELYSFKSIINSDVLAILNINPHGYIRFTFRGGTYEGFINKIEAGDYTLEANYELIAKQLSYGENFIFEDNTNFVTEENENLVFE